jgi:hypothetical protein
MSVNIVNDALKYYDFNNDKYKAIKNRIKYIKRDTLGTKDIESFKATFYDKDRNELFTSKIEILGKYYSDMNIWIWGWSLPDIDKFLTTIIRKVFLYGTDINVSNNPSNFLLKNELITSRFKIDDYIQLEMHCAIAAYLAKKPFIFPLNNLLFDIDSVIEIKENTNSDIIIYIIIIDPPDI